MRGKRWIFVPFCLAILTLESCEYPAEQATVPTFSDYDRVALEMMTADTPPSFMREFKSIFVMCVGADSSIACSNQAAAILHARGLVQRKQGEGYALSFNTQYEGGGAKVTVSLINRNYDVIYQHTATVFATDAAKAGRNLRAALAWKFATKWAIANHIAPKLVDLQSFLDL
jgi:hypothetical protein